MFKENKTVKLKEIANISAGQSSPYDNDFTDVGTPFIKAGNLEKLKNGMMREEQCNLVDENVIKKCKLKLHKAGTVLIAKSGMSCLSGHVYSLRNDAYVVSHLACVEAIEEKYIELIKWYFIINGTKKIIKDPSYPSIQLVDFSNIEIPKATEQDLNIFNNFVKDLDKSKVVLKESIKRLIFRRELYEK